MEEFCKQVVDQLNSYKRKSESDLLKCIPVYAGAEIQAFLRPLTFDYSYTIPQCAELLCKWRLDFPTSARSQVLITKQSTDNWIKNTILNTSDRILFLIFGTNMIDLLGHIGLCEVDPARQLMHLDLVMRGVQGVLPGLMGNSIHALMAWGKKELQLKTLAVETFFDNERAVRLYERCGFHMFGRRPLVCESLKNGIRWVFADERQNIRAERYECMMECVL